MDYTIYETTNNKNGKKYIGFHITENPNDEYLGSGSILGKAIKKYGKESFTKKVLFIFNNSEDMFAKEAELVNEDWVSSPETYNIKLGGFGGWDYINKRRLGQKGFANIYHNDPSYRKRFIENCSIAQKKRLEDPIELEKAMRAIKKAKEKSMELYPQGTFLGKHHSKNTKRKIGEKNSLHQQGSRNSNYGKFWITNGSESKPWKGEIPDGWCKGRICKPKLLP